VKGGMNAENIQKTTASDTSHVTHEELSRDQEYVEITNGLPFPTAQAFFDHLWNSFYDEGIIRFPIIGFRQPDNTVKVYMLLRNNKNGSQTHASLLNRFGLDAYDVENDKNSAGIAFTTSFEVHTPVEPQKSYTKRELYLELKALTELDEEPVPYYVMVGHGSDLLLPPFTSEGEAWLTKIVKPLGIELKSTNPHMPVIA
jgi:hypothetical protein